MQYIVRLIPCCQRFLPTLENPWQWFIQQTPPRHPWLWAWSGGGAFTCLLMNVEMERRRRRWQESRRGNRGKRIFRLRLVTEIRWAEQRVSVQEHAGVQTHMHTRSTRAHGLSAVLALGVEQWIMQPGAPRSGWEATCCTLLSPLSPPPPSSSSLLPLPPPSPSSPLVPGLFYPHIPSQVVQGDVTKIPHLDITQFISGYNIHHDVIRFVTWWRRCLISIFNNYANCPKCVLAWFFCTTQIRFCLYLTYCQQST